MSLGDGGNQAKGLNLKRASADGGARMSRRATGEGRSLQGVGDEVFDLLEMIGQSTVANQGKTLQEYNGSLSQGHGRLLPCLDQALNNQRHGTRKIGLRA